MFAWLNPPHGICHEYLLPDWRPEPGATPGPTHIIWSPLCPSQHGWTWGSPALTVSASMAWGAYSAPASPAKWFWPQLGLAAALKAAALVCKPLVSLQSGGALPTGSLLGKDVAVVQPKGFFV
jgi:hypothetical protein